MSKVKRCVRWREVYFTGYPVILKGYASKNLPTLQNDGKLSQVFKFTLQSLIIDTVLLILTHIFSLMLY